MTRRVTVALIVVALVASGLTLTSTSSVLTEDGLVLSFTTSPADATGGAPFGVQPVVVIEDAEGATVDTDVDVTLALSGGPEAAVLDCAATTAVSGVATFNGCAIDVAGSGYTLVATADGIADATSATFAVDVGEPETILFTTQPAAIVAGEAFAAAPAIELRDAGGNAVVPDGHSLGLVAAASDGAPVSLTGCTGGRSVDDQGATFYSVDPTDGQTAAVFAGCTVPAAGIGYTLLAVAVPDDEAGESIVDYSESFDVTGGAADRLVFTSEPGGAVSGEALTRQPVVALQDSNGNVVPLDEDVSLSVDRTDPQNAPFDVDVELDCGAENPQSISTGVATFETCTVNAIERGFLGDTLVALPEVGLTLTAMAGGLQVVSAPFGRSATGGGAVDQLAFTTQPGDGTGGTPLANQPVVEAQDASGAIAPALVELSLGSDPGGATLTCSNTTAPAPRGVATFYGCAVDRAGAYTLIATDQETGTTVESEAFTVAAGDAAQIAIVAAPTEAIAGTPFTAGVEVRDAGGNVVATSSDVVRLALASGGDGNAGRLDCADDNVATATEGSASFSDCSIDRPGTYRLIATTPVGIAVSQEFPVLVGPPAAVTFISAPEAAIDGGTLATPRVLVEDAGGNTVDASVTLTAAGGTLAACHVTVPAEHGVAAFPGCGLTAPGSSVTLAASAGTATATVDVPVSHDAPVGGAAASIPLTQTFGGDDYANNPSFVTNDVNAATGALQFSNDDITVAGIGVPFVLTRTYNSADGTGGSFGPGWSSVFDAGVVLHRDGSATVRAEDGQQLAYAKEEGCRKNCELVPPPGATSTLVCMKSTCTVTRTDGGSFTSTDGRILRYEAHTGHGLGFNYDRKGNLTEVTVTTADGPLAIQVTTDDGLVTGLTTPTRSLSYGYSDGVLTSATDPTGNTTTYGHDTDGRLTERRLGAERLSVAYRGDGRVATAATTGQQRRYADRYEWSVDGNGIGTSTRFSAVHAHGEATEAVYLERYRDNVLVSEQAPNGATLLYSVDESANIVAFQDALGNVERFTYSAAGDLVAKTSADGGVARFAYDDQHRQISITDPLGNTTAYHYAGKNLHRVVPPDPGDPSNQPGPPGKVATFFDYDEFDRVVRVTSPTSIKTISYDAAGNQTGFQTFDRSDTELLDPINGPGPHHSFDEAGNLVRAVDPRGHETTYAYDPNGRQTEQHLPTGAVTRTTYTPTGEIATSTAPGQGTTTYAWDDATRTQTATGATPGRIVFDPAGSVVSRTDAGGRTTTNTYDASGLVVAETDPADKTIRQFHDAAGNVVKAVDDEGILETDFQLGRPVAQILDGSVISTTAYDLVGQTIARTDADGQQTSVTYDNHLLVSSVQQGAGTTSYTYDGDENLASVTDGNGHTTTFTHDAAGQRITRTVGGSTWAYGYDVAGNPTSIVDPDGRTTTYTLDAAGRRVGTVHRQTGESTIEITQTFDDLDRRVSMTDPTGTHTFGYDDRGNLSSVESPTGTFTHDYSTPGQRTDTYPDGTVVSYDYDDTQRLMTLSAPGVSVAYTRNAARDVTGIATGNGLFETFGYDADGLLTSQDLRCGSDSVMTTRYGYDAAFSPLGTERTVAGQTVSTGYGYDGTGQLTSQRLATAGTPALPGAACAAPTSTPVPAPGPGTPGDPDDVLTPPTDVNDPLPVPGLEGLVPATERPITYDPVGNRTSADGVSFSYDDADRLVAGSDGRTASYDGAGNLTSSTVDGDTTTYRYDAAGRLTEVALPDGRTVTYTVDGDGTRVGRSIDGGPETTYDWDRSGDVALLVLERDASGDFRRYFYGVGAVAMQTEDETFYLHGDRRNDITAVSDSTGAVVATYSYDAFGNRTATNSPSAPELTLGFASELLDADTGLYHLRAREYDPVVGRFTQRDPVGLPPGEPVVSPYLYADNQPTVLADASGQTALPIRNVGNSTESATMGSGAKAGVGASRFFVFSPVPKMLANAKVLLKIEKFVGSAKGAVGAADDIARFAKYSKAFLAVGAVALGAYIVYEDCTNGTTAQCVAASISLAFTVGCLAVSGLAANVLCGGAAIGITYVTANYGPEIADAYASADNTFNAVFGTTIAVGLTGLCVAFTAGVATAACAVGGLALAAVLVQVDFEQGFIDLGNALAEGFSALGFLLSEGFIAIGGAIATGFNDLAGYITSGFAAAFPVILRAGVELGIAIALLKDTFSKAGAEVVAELTDFGYEIADFATEVADFFASTPELAARFFQGIGYEVEQVALAVDEAFSDAVDWSAEALTGVLAAAGYAFDEVVAGLATAYAVTAAEFLSIGRTLNYGVQQIAGGLEDVYSFTGEQFAALGQTLDLTAREIAAGLQDAYAVAAAGVVQTLRDLGVAFEAIGDAVEGAFGATIDWSREALADALQAAGATAEDVTRAFQGAYAAASAEVVEVLLALDFTVNQISGALQSAYAASAAELTEIFVDLGVAVTLIADALVEVYGQAAGAVRDLLGAAGAALEDLGDFFGDLGDDIADTLNPANW